VLFCPPFLLPVVKYFACLIANWIRSSSVSTRNVGGEYVVTTIKSNGNPVTQYYVTKKGDSKIVRSPKKYGGQVANSMF